MPSASRAPTDPPASACHAHLRYVTAGAPGLSRQPAPGGFAYRTAGGRRIRDARTLRRIQALAIPPAWTDVWICADPEGHLQATGRDARGRKQYRYHPRWHAVRDEAKYGRLPSFAHALPGIRRRVAASLRAPDRSRERVLATVLRLLETTLIRVSNDEYARANRSFGLTTLLDRHVAVRGHRVRFRFNGKSGVRQTLDLHDPELARTVKRRQELPGQLLFQYLDETGLPQRDESGDVNDYLREAAGQEFTAKDHVGRNGAGRLRAARRRPPRFDDRAKTATRAGHRLGGGASREHPCRVPSLLRPSGGARCLHGRSDDPAEPRRRPRPPSARAYPRRTRGAVAAQAPQPIAPTPGPSPSPGGLEPRLTWLRPPRTSSTQLDPEAVQRPIGVPLAPP